MALPAPIIVIDNGSHALRAGHPNEAAPRVALPALVGQPLNAGVAMAVGVREYEVGYEAVAKRGILTCASPVRAGIIENWDAMEKLWAHVIFRELRVAPENFCFVISEPFNAPLDQKERALELLMETFKAHSLYLGVSSVFSLYSYGKTTGVALDVGLHTSAAVPVHEGYCLARQVTSSPVAGAALTSRLAALLRAQGYGFGTAREMELINSVKERLCFVMPCGGGGGLGLPPDPSASAAANASDDGAAEFLLPDGQPIPLGEERHKCPEALFNFGILGREFIPRAKVFLDAGDEYTPSIDKGISWLTYAAISSAEASLRGALIDNVVLAGGGSLFRGVRARVQRELCIFFREIRPNEAMIPISVSEVPCRSYGAWLGGCMLSSVSMFPHLTVSREEYEENGPRIIHCKNL